MNFHEYQLAAARTMKKGRSFEDDLADYALGLSEAGECQNKLKKYLYHGHSMDKDSVAEELGDILWYIAALATTLNLDLGEIARTNIEKLKKRYPDGFSEEKSREREEADRKTGERVEKVKL